MYVSRLFVGKTPYPWLLFTLAHEMPFYALAHEILFHVLPYEMPVYIILWSCLSPWHRNAHYGDRATRT